MCYLCQTVTLSFEPDDLEPELKRIAKLIHAGKLQPGQIDKAMVKKIARQLMSGVFKGYGKDFSSEDLTIEERSFLNLVNKNVYVFSGFKNYHELKEASMLLKTDDGVIKPFNQFLDDVLKVDKTYNQAYLSAEYGNALASAQMAQTWHDYEKSGVKMLTYQTAGDDRVRDEHRILDGITLPVDDPFWSTYYPPNDWGCRCDVAPSVGGPVKEDAKALPDLPKMFRNNVGKSGIIFPDTHPYFEASKKDRQVVIKQVADILSDNTPKGFTPDNLLTYERELSVKVDEQIFDYLKQDTAFTFNSGGAYYDFKVAKVNIPFDERRKNSKWYSEAVVYHEFGHAADFQSGYQKLSSVSDLMAKYKRKYKNDFARLTSELTKGINKGIVAKDYDSLEQHGAVLDTIMSLDKRHGRGHGYKIPYQGKMLDYFDVPGFKEAEFIAHSFENRFAGNPVFEKHMPDLYADMISLIKSFK